MVTVSESKLMACDGCAALCCAALRCAMPCNAIAPTWVFFSAMMIGQTRAGIPLAAGLLLRHPGPPQASMLTLLHTLFRTTTPSTKAPISSAPSVHFNLSHPSPVQHLPIQSNPSQLHSIHPVYTDPV